MERVDCAGVSSIKALRVLWLKGEWGGGERGGLLQVGRSRWVAFLYQSGAQMANNYSSACAWLLASQQLSGDWCNPLLFMIVWDFFLDRD